MIENDTFTLGGHTFSSRFILGSGKYNLDLIRAAVSDAGAQIITLAVRRANTKDSENILDYIPEGVTLLPNTSGARNADEAVRIARLAREMGCGDFVKIEIMHDSKYLLPDNYETIKATEILAKEGFIVMPYMYPDLNAARDLANAGAACVMPLGAPIGSNMGLVTKEFIQILIDEIDLPVIVDAGIGKPSQACEAMEMGAAAIMANTAIATAGNIPEMAKAFGLAIEAGRRAYLSGLGRVLNKNAYSAMEDCDVIGWIVDGSQAFGTGDSFILKRIETLHKPVVLIMNKIDKLPKEQLLKRLMYWQKQYDFNDIVPISALDKDNLEELLKVFKGYLPEGEPMFPEEMKSDHDINFRMCEIVREKILFKTHEEIPHSVAVILERKEKRGNRMYLQMMVVVDRESQKGILIGKQASMIRSIRLEAQKELKDMLGCSVDLELFVRVEKNWRNHENKIKEFGLDELEQIDED